MKIPVTGLEKIQFCYFLRQRERYFQRRSRLLIALRPALLLLDTCLMTGWAKSSFFIAIFLLGISSSHFAHAKILKTTGLQVFVNSYEFDESTLVVLDMDGTLIKKPSVPTDIEAWRSSAIAYLISKNTHPNFAEKQVDRFIQEQDSKVMFSSAEPQTLELIKSIQTKGAEVIVMTAQPGWNNDLTVFQLLTFGLEFKSTSTRIQRNPFLARLDIGYRDGVMSVGYRNEKGGLLREFIVTNNLSPNKILFLDNDIKNIRSVDAALLNFGIQNDNVHYTPGSAPSKKVLDCSGIALQEML